MVRTREQALDGEERIIKRPQMICDALSPRRVHSSSRVLNHDHDLFPFCLSASASFHSTGTKLRMADETKGKKRKSRPTKASVVNVSVEPVEQHTEVDVTLGSRGHETENTQGHVWGRL